jgi:hypothetical protein
MAAGREAVGPDRHIFINVEVKSENRSFGNGVARYAR